MIMEGDAACDIDLFVPGRLKTVFTIMDHEFETDITYFLMDHIGSGSYGVVCSAIDLETGEEVAIKKVADTFDFTDDAADTLREMMILRQIQHPNIIALKSVMWPRLETEFEDVYMVLELMETSLHSYMKSRAEALPEDEIRRFMFEILCGVNYLHSANIMHRDLKPDNILIDSEGHVKICDFGLSVSIDGSRNVVMPAYVGTRWYRAPELLVGNTNYGPAIDIWSVGCIFAEMLGGGVRIFFGCSTKNQLYRIITKLGKPGEEDIGFIKEAEVRRFVESHPCSAGKSFATLFPKADAYALDLLEKMLTFNPMKRISAAEALRHPYMTPYWNPDAKTGPAVPARCLVELDVDGDMEEDEVRMKMLSEMQYYLKH